MNLIARSVGALTLVLALGTLHQPASAAPTPQEARGWQVQPGPAGDTVVSWTAPQRLPITSDRPTIVGPDGVSLGPTTVAADGRTLSVVLTGAAAPDPDTLDVVLSGDRLDEPGRDIDSAPSARSTVPAPAATLSDDPATPGPHQVVSSDYTLPAVKLAGLPRAVEMVGHVVEPALDSATGSRPLVIFLHGRHEFCYAPAGDGGDTWKWPCKAPLREVPGHLGYDYLQRLLASQGYATVSIRANGINAQDHRVPDGGAAARADLVDAHLVHWASLAARRHVDLDQVVLVGHSRGGEGVNRVSLRTPLEAGHRIAGQVLIAPTDFGSQTSPYVPTVAVLPYCDGDVSTLEGQRYVDFGRDLAADDTSLKSAVLLMGANHNYFNTEWTPGSASAPAMDDWYGKKKAFCGKKHADRLTAKEQRGAASALVTGAVRLFTRDEQQFLPMYDGTAATVRSMGRAVAQSAALGGGRVLSRPGREVTVRAGSTATASVCRAVSSHKQQAALCGRRTDAFTPNWPSVGERLPERHNVEIGWQRTGATAVLDLAKPLDLSAGRLDLRTTVDPGRGPVRIGVRLTDGDGATSALLTPDEVPVLPGGASQARHWARTVRVATSAVTGIDLGRVTSIEVVGRSATGRVWIHDLAAVPASLAGVPTKRLPVVDFAKVRVDEGNGAGQGSAALTFRVGGTVTESASIRVVINGQKRSHVDLSLEPGQTGGSVAIPFPRNQTYDDHPVTVETMAVAATGATTGNYLGRVTVVDDETPPRVRLRGARKVSEGNTIRLTIKLAGPVTDERYYAWRFVKARGTLAKVGDLSAGWRRQFGHDDPAVALHRSGHYGHVTVRPGKRKAVIRIPTARDNLREGTEHLAIKVRGEGLRKQATVRIIDRGR